MRRGNYYAFSEGHQTHCRRILNIKHLSIYFVYFILLLVQDKWPTKMFCRLLVYSSLLLAICHTSHNTRHALVSGHHNKFPLLYKNITFKRTQGTSDTWRLYVNTYLRWQTWWLLFLKRVVHSSIRNVTITENSRYLYNVPHTMCEQYVTLQSTIIYIYISVLYTMSLKYTHCQQPSKTREYEDRWPRIANNIIVLLLEV